LKVTIEKSGDRLKLDFSGSSPQRRSSLNVPMCYTRAVAYYTLKCLFASDLPNNEGTFSPIEIHAPEGCVLNVISPVATGARHTIGHYVFPLIMGALKDLIPDRVVTEMGMMNVFNVFGKHEDGGEIASLFFLTGGFGALAGQDGRAAIPGPGNMTALSSEVWEDLTSTTIRYRRILPDTGGFGENPGGPGQEIEMENSTSNDMTISFLGLRTRIPARGLLGGGPGMLRRFLIDGDVVDGEGKHTLAPGSVLRIQEAGAGGLGDPARRPVESVQRDIDRGYITTNYARNVYPQYAHAVPREAAQ
jgi:N-methylhydantoinase B